MGKYIPVDLNRTLVWTNGKKKYRLRVFADEISDSPRGDAPVALMACWYNRYLIGDKLDSNTTPDKFWQALVDKHCTNEDVVAAIKAGKLDGIRLVPCDGDPERYDVYYGGAEFPEYKAVHSSWILSYIHDDLEISECMKLLEPCVEWLPLWVYEHSGITMSCGDRSYPYNDRWDSGQIGWIIAEKEKIMRETADYALDENGEQIMVEHIHADGTVKRCYKLTLVTEDTWRAKAVEVMRNEVNEYDQWLRGEVYGYDLLEYPEEAPNDDALAEEIDSCLGFYGDNLMENGIPETCGCGLAEALRSGDYEEVA